MDARIKSGWVIRIFCIILSISLSPELFAQVTTGTISGTVTDTSGSVIPGVAVKATHVETGIARDVVSDNQGRYRIQQLGLGDYSVQAQMTGFQTEIRSGIRLTVGREAVVNLELQVGAVAERVEVTGEAPLVQTTDATVSYLVDEATMRDLPLNGRSYTQLATLQPGVVPNNNYVGNVSGGTGLNLVVQGQRPTQNLFLLDGSIGNDYTSRTPAGVGGNSLGVEAIQEFSLLSGNYSAEYGTALGGVINLVTRSGTNTLHGSVFEFLRNSSLDAKNYFDPKDKAIAPFRRNQFGVALGGPIKRDRVFFFGNFETMLERKAGTDVITVPNANAHQGILPSGTVPISPATKPLIDSLPLPNVPGRLDFGDGTGQFVHNPKGAINQYYFMSRVDYQLSNSHSFFGRYTFDDSAFTKPETIPVFKDIGERRDQFATVRLNSVLNPTTVNTVTLGFTRTIGQAHTEDIFAFPADYKFLSSAAKVGAFVIRTPSLSVGSCAGCRIEAPRLFALNIFDLNEKVALQKGAHSLTFGGTARRYRFNEHAFRDTHLGTPTFDNIRDLLTADAVNFSAAKPGFNDRVRGNRSTLLGVFVQDDFRVSPRFTLNLGLRYEMGTTPREVNGKASIIFNDLTDTAPVVQDIYFETSKKNFAPRFGFAWDPFGTGRTSLRGGGGIFYTIIIPEERGGVGIASQVPFDQGVTLVRGTDPIVLPRPFENPALVLRNVPLNQTTYEPVAKAPTRYYWTFGIQHEIISNTVLSATYSGSHTVHLLLGSDSNTRIPEIINGREFYSLTPRRNPNFNSVSRRGYNGNSFYNGLSINLNRRFASGFGGQVTYTWSKVLTDSDTLFTTSESLNSSGNAQNFYDRRNEWSRGTFDVRHRFVTNITWDLPLGDHEGFAQALLEGWQVSTILESATGLPYTAKTGFNRSRDVPTGAGDNRPDLAPGFTHNVHEGATAGCPGLPANLVGHELGDPALYFDPCAFALQPVGFYGNLGRGTLQGPDKFNLDFSVKKTTAFTERVKLEFRAEFFNLLNHPTFSGMNVNLFTTTGGRQGATGRLTSTLTDSRQIQFGLKLSF